MPVITTSQEPDWNNNVYVITTTRVFVLIGTAYLLRSLYNVVSPNWGPRLASILGGEFRSRSSPPCSVTSHIIDNPFMPCSYYERARPRADKLGYLAHGISGRGS